MRWVNPGGGAGIWIFPFRCADRQQTAHAARQLKIAAGLLVGLLGLAASPFLAQSFELQMANARLESNRELSVEARQDQAVVVEFENRGAPSMNSLSRTWLPPCSGCRSAGR